MQVTGCMLHSMLVINERNFQTCLKSRGRGYWVIAQLGHDTIMAVIGCHCCRRCQPAVTLIPAVEGGMKEPGATDRPTCRTRCRLVALCQIKRPVETVRKEMVVHPQARPMRASAPALHGALRDDGNVDILPLVILYQEAHGQHVVILNLEVRKLLGVF